MTVDYGLLALAVIGLVVAHAANNMINDYFDLEGGVDTDDYVRALYAPHPILSGWVTKRQLGAAILLANAVDLAIMLVLFAARGPLVIAFALAGLFISVFYVAPPIRLKHIGLGEPGVFLVWGPLMVAGTFFVATGALPGWVWIASLPYAILVTTVLFGKHIDKIEADAQEGRPDAAGDPRRATGAARGPGADDRVLPDRGRRRARRLDRAVGGARRPRHPAARSRRCGSSRRRGRRRPPHSYVGWPLWFVGGAFVHTRRAGACWSSGCFSTRSCRSRCPGSKSFATVTHPGPARCDGCITGMRGGAPSGARRGWLPALGRALRHARPKRHPIASVR